MKRLLALLLFATILFSEAKEITGFLSVLIEVEVSETVILQ